MTQDVWYGLSVWQPHASLLVSGVQNLDNRPWQDAPELLRPLRAVMERGERLAVYAARTVSEAGMQDARAFLGENWKPGELPLGVLVGVVQPFAVTGWSVSPWAVSGHQHIHMRRAQAFAVPIPCRCAGAPGLFELPAAVALQVEAALTGGEHVVGHRAV